MWKSLRVQSPRQDRPEGFSWHGETAMVRFGQNTSQNSSGNETSTTPGVKLLTNAALCVLIISLIPSRNIECVWTLAVGSHKVSVSSKLVNKNCCFCAGMESHSWDCSPTKQTRCCSQTYLSRCPSGWSRSVCPPPCTWKWSNSPCWTPGLGRCST